SSPDSPPGSSPDSSPGSSPGSPPGSFPDDDLSQATEITDEAGTLLMSLPSPDWLAPSLSEAGKTDGRGFRELQAEMIHLELIDAEEDIQEEQDHWGLIHGFQDDHRLNQEERRAIVLTPVRQKQPNVIESESAEHRVTMDTYRPKRPTTLALFPQPQPPRTQVGAVYFYPVRTRIIRSSDSETKHLLLQLDPGLPDGPPPGGKNRQQHVCHEERQPEATEEIYLTPVHQKNPDTDCDTDRDRPFLSQSSEGNRMSISSDAEGPPAYTNTTLPDRTNPSISEEDEVYLHPSAPPPRDRDRGMWDRGSKSRSKGGSGALRTAHTQSSEADGLSYDSVKYTLVVDEHAQLELVSLKQCYHSYSEDSDTETVYESANEEDYEVDHSELKRERRKSSRLSRASSSSEAGVGGGPRTRKFLNVFVNGRLHSSGAESFGLFSCVLDGVEQEQSHRAVFRFVPRHDDELELEVDDPLLMEAQADDLWCKAYNMRTGASGIFPAYYAAKVTQEQSKGIKYDDWVDRFRVKFLGSVNVPYHKGNDVLCAAMQKIATNRRMTMQPPSTCVLEINMKGVKIIVQDECRTSERGDKCFHFFQLKNISFCGCHPKHNKYFGFITKHPDHQRFACHVFMSDDSMMPLAESVGKAFQLYYKETVGYSCPTEDIFIE
uniref:Mitogen-activated protein kinase 8 interacting protein 1a n=1 Tax=Oncorhynchus mykiss TaxID=8022 RepID=A0A8K9XJW9_ONCMY